VIQREAIYSALWNLATKSYNFAAVSRRLRPWADVKAAEQPFLCMAEAGMEGLVKALGAATVWTLHARLYIYVHSSDPYRSPSELLNPLIDAVDVAMAPDFTGIQNLGLPEMVVHSYIEGRIETDEGVLGDQAIAEIPIKILCA
jgi:hypothetical protein